MNGLTPLDEQRSLNDEPLPLQEIDKTIPSQIAEIDSEIAHLELEIKELSLQRLNLLDKALKYNILEDAKYKINHIVRKIRSLNVIRFKEIYPDEYDKIVDLQKKQAIEKAEQFIPIATAEKFVTDLNEKEVFDITERENWIVEKKQ